MLLSCESNSSGALYCIVSLFRAFQDCKNIFKLVPAKDQKPVKFSGAGQMTPPSSMFVLGRLIYFLTKKNKLLIWIKRAVRVSCVGDHLFLVIICFDLLKLCLYMF